MRKLINVVLICVCFLSMGCFFACGEDNSNNNGGKLAFEFNIQSIELDVGTKYNPFDYIETQFTLENQAKISFVSSNSNVFFVTPDKNFIATGFGSADLEAYYDGSLVTKCKVEIKKPVTYFNAPVNVSYNNETGFLTWNNVYSQGDNGIITASTYTVEKIKNNQTPEIFQTITNEFNIYLKSDGTEDKSQIGDYTFRVKANASGGIGASDYTKNSLGDYLYYHFSIMSKPTDLTYDKTTNSLSWDPNGNPTGTKYFVYVNGENVCGNTGTISTNFTFNTDKVQSYEVYVEALPITNEYYLATSEKISLLQLDKTVISFNNGLISWNAQEKAEKYEVSLFNRTINSPLSTTYITENSYTFENMTEGDYRVEIRAIGDEEENVFSGVEGEYFFSKLPTAVIQFNEDNRQFSVINSSVNSIEHDYTIFFGQEGVEGDNIFVSKSSELNGLRKWTNTNTDAPFHFSAKIYALDEKTEIDGDVTTDFVLASNHNKHLKFIKNLKAPDLSYYETNENNAVIAVDNGQDLNCDYVIYKNNSPTPLQDVTEFNNMFTLGNVNEVFTFADVYNFKVLITKQTDVNTIYMGCDASINIEKIEAPNTISLDTDNSIIVDGTSTKVTNKYIVSIDNIFNGANPDAPDVVETKINSVLDVTAKAWNIKVSETSSVRKFVTDENNIAKYFTSSNQTTFRIERILPPDNILMNYNTKTASWSQVDHAVKYSTFVNGVFEREISGLRELLLDEYIETCELSIVSHPAEWNSITSLQTGYLSSFESSLLIEQVDEIADYYLDYNADTNVVTANWTTPANLMKNQIIKYNIFVDKFIYDGNNNLTTEKEGFVNIVNSIPFEQNHFSFESGYFNKVNTYDIKVKIVCENNDFYVPNNNDPYLTLRKLAPINTLSQQDEILTINDVDSSKVTGNEINGAFQNVTNKTFDVSNLTNGESLTFTAKRIGIFSIGTLNNVTKKYEASNYNLDSDTTTFIVKRLKTPTNIVYTNGIFTWDNTLNNDATSITKNFIYYTDPDDGISAYNRTMSDMPVGGFELDYDYEFDFYLAHLNTSPRTVLYSQESLEVGVCKVLYLDSFYSEGFNVVREQTVENMQIVLNAQNDVKLLWDYDDVDTYTTNTNYNNKFIITLTMADESVEDVVLTKTPAETFSAHDNKFAYTFDHSIFETVGEYTFTIEVLSDLTLHSDVNSCSITKLPTIDNVYLNGTNAVLVDGGRNAIDHTGIERMVLTGDVETINENDTFSLATMNPEDLFTINIKAKAILPENVTDGVYYLDSETTTFRFSKMADITVWIDSHNAMLGWSDRLQADSYTIRIDMGVIEGNPNGDHYYEYIDVDKSTTQMSLADPNLTTKILNAGTYPISVIANVDSRVIGVFSEELSAPVGYLGTNYKNSVNMVKIAGVDKESVVISSSTDIQQKAVTITWDNVAEASSYDLYISTTKSGIGTLLVNIPKMAGSTSSYTSSTDFSAESEYFIYLVCLADGKMSSIPPYLFENAPSEQRVKFLRLNSVAFGNVNSNYILTWSQTAQVTTNLYDYSYIVEIYDSASNLKFTYGLGDGDPSTTEDLLKINSIDLSDNDEIVGDEWLSDLSNGLFSARVYIVGNGYGTGQTNGKIATFSSNFFTISGVKFIHPTIEIQNNSIVIGSSDSTIYPDEIQYMFTVTDNNNVTMVNNQVISQPFEIPSSWLAGTYTITSYATSKNGYNGFIKSNVSTIVIERLPQVDGLQAIVVNDTDLSQQEIQLSWNAVQGADDYSIYVNGINKYNTLATDDNDSLNKVYNFVTNDFFTEIGEYTVTVKASAGNKINSINSDTISIVRLNPLFNAYLLENSDKEEVVYWDDVAQYNSSYTFSLQLVDPLFQTVEFEESNIESGANTGATIRYNGLIGNTWIENYDGGNFKVNIRVVGNGDSRISGVTTLSSKVKEINVFKLFVPEIEMRSNEMQINLGNNAGQNAPNGENVNEITEKRFSIKYNGDYALSSSNSQLEQVIYNDLTHFVYPDKQWDEGVYSVTSYVTLCNASICNVLTSNTTSVSTTRIATPTNLSFYRANVGTTAVYTSDGELSSSDFISDKIYFKFNEVPNVAKFIMQNGLLDNGNVNLYETELNNDIEIVGEFESFVNNNPGVNTLKVIASASGGQYINSKSAEIQYTTLNKINRFYSDGGRLNWNSQTNVNYYLVKAIDNATNNVKYWQSLRQAECYSSLKGIIDSISDGQLALNIKAIGNIPVGTGISSGLIVLDSPYMENIQSFTKIPKVTNLKATLGYISFKKASSASEYVAKICDMDDNYILTTPLEEYTAKLQYTGAGNVFLGYSSEIMGLVKDQFYKVYIQSRAEGESFIYSDYSSSINFKVLSNANTPGDIKININPSSDLTKTRLTVNVCAESYGLLRFDDESDTIIVEEENEKQYLQRDALDSEGKTLFTILDDGRIQLVTDPDYFGFSKNVFYTYASLGSSVEISRDGVSFYYLTSEFTQSKNIWILGQPEIYVENGIIKWSTIPEADGYYVYINENLYGLAENNFTNSLYTKNSLALSDAYGGYNNTDITIKVVAVTCQTDAIYGPDAVYKYVYHVAGTEHEEYLDLDKLATPLQLNIEDGALVWSDGVSTLSNYSTAELLAVLPTGYFESDCTNFENYMKSLFQLPLNIYSKYNGFEFSTVELKFTNQETNQAFIVTTTLDKLLKFTQEQCLNLISLRDILLPVINSLLESYVTSGGNRFYGEMNVPYDDADSVNFAYFNNLKIYLESEQFQRLVEIYEEEYNGWPNINELFQELENSDSIALPSGKYGLQIRQIGNNMNWLTSNYSAEQNLYLPAGTSEIKIKQDSVSGDFLLVWNDVAIPSQYSFAPRDTDGDSVGEKYILYGQTKTVNGVFERREIARFNGTRADAESKLFYNLSNLINANILTTDIVTLFLVVAGDDNQVVRGLNSELIPILVLPQLAPSMLNGQLTWIGQDASIGYEIKAYNSLNVVQKLILSKETLSWVGDELEESTSYTISIRSIGSIIFDDSTGITSYTLSGQKIDIAMHKLAKMDVDVDIYGIFVWDPVLNSQGFTVELEDYPKSPDIYTGENLSYYETEYSGFNTYLFRTLGTREGATIGIVQDEEYTTYYLNSHKLGKKGCTLQTITNVWVEDGYIKWNPLLNDNASTQQGLNKIIGYRLAIDNGIGQLYTTKSSDIAEKDIFIDALNNVCFDFTSYGDANELSKNYSILVQAYVYFTNPSRTQLQPSTITNPVDTLEYNLLMSLPKYLEYSKIDPPTNITVEDGAITWQGNTAFDYVIEIMTKTNETSYSLFYTETVRGVDCIVEEGSNRMAWWSDSANLNNNVNYYVKIKSYQQGHAYSVYTHYIDLNTQQPKGIMKLTKLQTTFTKILDSNTDENKITFNYENSSVEVGFNIRYKLSPDETEWSYITTTNKNTNVNVDYNSVVKNVPPIVSIIVDSISENISWMNFQVQIVPKGEQNYLKSDWSDVEEYTTPDAIDMIYVDTLAENKLYEFYWEHLPNRGYLITDMIYNDYNFIVATYSYRVNNDVSSSDAYYKVREVEKNGEIVSIGTINYIPTIMGYYHKIAVKVILDPLDEYSLASEEVSLEQLYRIDIFTAESDFYASNGEIASMGTYAEQVAFIQNHPYGTSSNPFLISNVDSILCLNNLLTRYDYTYKYKVEISQNIAKSGYNVNNSFFTVNETELNYYFKQTCDLLLEKDGGDIVGGLTQSIGYVSENLDMFKGFENTYDGGNHIIEYQLTAIKTNERLGLFSTLESNGVVKNVKVKANINFNGVLNSTFVVGGIVAKNNGGNIINSTLVSINLTNLTTNDNQSGLTSLTFGGIVGDNNGGTIEHCFSIANEISLYLSASGTSIYSGGIAGKNSGIIKTSGNTTIFQVTSKNYAYVGGIVGFNSGSTSAIQQSYNKANINALTSAVGSECYVGGITGSNDKASISSCYSIGNVACSNSLNCTVYIGGIVGYSNIISITNCYTVQTISGSSGTFYFGAIVGYLNASIPAATDKTLLNHFISMTGRAVGETQQGSSQDNFAVRVAEDELKASLMNERLSSNVYKNTGNFPIFIWE